MDEMTLISKFATGVCSRIIRFFITKKVGYKIGFDLNSVTAKIEDGKIKVHIDANAELSTTELLNILHDAGIN